MDAVRGADLTQRHKAGLMGTKPFQIPIVHFILNIPLQWPISRMFWVQNWDPVEILFAAILFDEQTWFQFWIICPWWYV